MDIQLTDIEARVIGCLIEKQVTTPDQYPLSLNSLTSACNQKSNREPVLNLSNSEVQQAVDELVKRRLVSEASGYGGRVAKYQHRFCNTEFGSLKFNSRELGVVCVLLLRGPQTPGELRTRSNRLCEFSDVGQVEATLQTLAEREDGPFVVRLPREPGRREARYAHLFSGEVNLEALAAAAAVSPGHAAAAGAEARISQLEMDVAELRDELTALKQQLKEY